VIDRSFWRGSKQSASHGWPLNPNGAHWGTSLLPMLTVSSSFHSHSQKGIVQCGPLLATIMIVADRTIIIIADYNLIMKQSR